MADFNAKSYGVHHVKDFNPFNFIESSDRTTMELSYGSDVNVVNFIRIDALIEWFWREYPNGSIVTDMISADRDGAVFKASVYADKTDIVPVSTGYCRKEHAEDEVYNYFDTAQTIAVRNALRYAGFGPEIYAELKKNETAADDELSDKQRENEQLLDDVLKGMSGRNASESKKTGLSGGLTSEAGLSVEVEEKGPEIAVVDCHMENREDTSMDDVITDAELEHLFGETSEAKDPGDEKIILKEGVSGAMKKYNHRMIRELPCEYLRKILKREDIVAGIEEESVENMKRYLDSAEE